MGISAAKLAIGLLTLTLGQAAIAEARPGSDRLLSSPQTSFGDLYRFNAQDFFVRGQEKLESEVQGLQRRRGQSERVLKVGADDRIRGDRLLCAGTGASSTATQICGD